MDMRLDRLQELAAHLESGALAHKTFDFVYINRGPFMSSGCGTAGCAMGECPTIFDEWRFVQGPTEYSEGYATFGHHDDPREASAEWFGISPEQVYHLFYPEQQLTQKYGGERLGNRADRYQVAANMRIFISKMREECDSPKPMDLAPMQTISEDTI